MTDILDIGLHKHSEESEEPRPYLRTAKDEEHGNIRVNNTDHSQKNVSSSLSSLRLR